MDHSTRVPKPDQPQPKPAAPVACVLLIGDTGYSVERLPADPVCGIVKAFRLTKVRIDQQYDIAWSNHGIECECPDFLYRHADQGPDDPGCKHIQALRQFGMLPELPATPPDRSADMDALAGLLEIRLDDETPF